MNAFTYSYPTKVYFGEGAVARAFQAELGRVGPRVMLAYGGGSIHRNGVYDEMMRLLREAGKTVVEFSCPIPPMPRCRRGLKWPGRSRSTSSSRWAAAA